MGKHTPKWLAENELIWVEFSVRLLTAYERADRIEFLLSTTELKNPDERAQVLKAKELLLKFIDGANLLDGLPKNAPRNAYRDKLRELSDQAAEIIEPLWKSWEISGYTPGKHQLYGLVLSTCRRTITPGISAAVCSARWTSGRSLSVSNRSSKTNCGLFPDTELPPYVRG